MGIIESFDLPLNLNDALPGSSEPLFIDVGRFVVCLFIWYI